MSFALLLDMLSHNYYSIPNKIKIQVRTLYIERHHIIEGTCKLRFLLQIKANVTHLPVLNLFPSLFTSHHQYMDLHLRAFSLEI